MAEFSEGKFFLCRELFLTKSSVSRTERSIPFCDRELKNYIAAKAAQFLYEACAPYQRYGQGFKRSVYQLPASASPYLQ